MIELWLKEYADVVQKDYSTKLHLGSRQNNHLYWAAWALGITGAAIDDVSLLDWSIAKATHGIYQIKEDGTLPFEMARGKRALSYHVFAAHPLVMVANLAAANNKQDLYKINNGALDKLIFTLLKGLENPEFLKIKRV